MIDPIRSLETSATQAAQPAAGVARPAAAGGVEGADFGTVLAEIASGSIATLKTGEASALAGLHGKASAQQVVEAVMSAEQTLQAALAIRDKVVAAYQEISRMAI